MVLGVPAAVAQAPAEVVHVAAAVTGAREKMDPFTGPFVSPQPSNPFFESAPLEYVIPQIITPLAAEGAMSDHILLKSVAVGELSYLAGPADYNWSWQAMDQYSTP
jgi:hypothetical protein